MSKRTLDLDKIINSYDEVTVGEKTYKIGTIKTKTLLSIQKIIQDNEDIPDDEKVDMLVQQIFLILSQDNTDVTEDSIKEWGLQGQIKFLQWFNEPFLELTQPTEDIKKKKDQA